LSKGVETWSKGLAKGKIAAVLIILIIGGTAGYFFYRNYAQGTVTLSITDPPSNQNGNNPHYNSTILHVYVTFLGIDIHQAGFGSTNDTGWNTIVGPPMTIDMLSVLTTSRTVATTNLATGSYDQLRFPISTAIVTFSTIGNVTYTVPSSTLKVTITGGGFQSSPGTNVQLLLTISFNDAEIMAMNGHLTPHTTATVT
jgi:uncharacterized protein DUF4382